MKIPPFKMKSLGTIISVLKEQDWMASIDLAEAYLHVPIHLPHHRFLRFAVENSHFQFWCLPFDLCSATRTFSKVLSAVIATLRVKDIQVFHYLDNLLILCLSKHLLLEHVSVICETPTHFGWLINHWKCQSQPTQVLEYLGEQFNAVRGRVFLPERKIQEIQVQTREVMA